MVLVAPSVLRGSAFAVPGAIEAPVATAAVPSPAPFRKSRRDGSSGESSGGFPARSGFRRSRLPMTAPSQDFDVADPKNSVPECLSDQDIRSSNCSTELDRAPLLRESANTAVTQPGLSISTCYARAASSLATISFPAMTQTVTIPAGRTPCSRAPRAPRVSVGA